MIAIQDGGSVRVVLELSGVGVAGVPLVDHERCCTGSEGCNPVVQGAELIGYGTPAAGIGLEVLTEPPGSAFEPILLTGGDVDLAVGQPIRPAWCGYLGTTEEGGQRRHRAVDTVVVAAGDGGTAVVDQLPIRVGSRVGADPEAVALAQCVLDGCLISGVLDRAEMALADRAA